MNLKKSLICDKQELLKYKKDILKLFLKAFGMELNESLWEWAYIENPNGCPIVSLYFDDDKLIGHYAAIPMNLLYGNQNVKALLSMTTMVDKDYRKYGIFVSQALEVYEKARQDHFQLVYGFPNKNSAPGFKKRLGWQVLENLKVVNVSYETIVKTVFSEKEQLLKFNTLDEENLSWRLSKPNSIYFIKDKNILKKYDSEYDLVFHDQDFNSLDQNMRYNILIDKDIKDIKDVLEEKSFNYLFGYKFFDQTLEGIDFKKDLILSDVF